MLQYIKPIILTAKQSLEARLAAKCAALNIGPINSVEIGWFGITRNPPECFVTPAHTLNVDQDETEEETHGFQIVVAAPGPDPEAATLAVIDYVAAVSSALEEAFDDGDFQAALQNGEVKHLHVEGHEYGRIFSEGAGMARTAMINVKVEAEESR